MRLEMEGKEPLLVLFGLPLLTAVIVIASMHYGQANTQVIPPPPVNVEAPHVSPRITAELPQGSINISNQVPAAQIHEIVKEVVRVPEIRVEPSRSPDVHVNVPRGNNGETRIIAVPTPVPMPVQVSTDERKEPVGEKPQKPVSVKSLEQEQGKNEADKTMDADPDGKLLPPPKPPGDPRNTVPAR